jgi:TRAP-type mannitol/chloroaromatic compound transport system permease small subunit
VQRRLIQFGTTLILTLCVWGHVSEIFDHWDNTFQTGYDIEYSTVIVVLVAGAVIAFAHVAAALIRRVSATPGLLPYFGSCDVDAPSLTAFVAHSPPRPLRV